MRCRPGEVDESVGDPQKIAVGKACELIRKEGKEVQKRSVKGLAKEVGLTESHFCRVFKKIMGMTVGEYRAQIVGERKGSGNGVLPGKTSAAVEIATSPSGFQSPMAGLQTQLSFSSSDSKLARDWHDFSGSSDLSRPLDMFPGTYVAIDFDFPPEFLSDASIPITTDDGFQFLNFDDGTPSMASFS
jgi:hypothetical protein